MTWKRVDPVVRFWEKVDTSGDCWLWTASLDGSKYGQFWVTHTHCVRAHRFSYELLVGPIPAGLQLDHKHTCPKRCVNPDHLRPATPKQNAENDAGPQRNSSSGVLGVNRARGNKWRARVRHNGKDYTAGVFDDVADAEVAVIALRNSLFTHNDADRQPVDPALIVA